MWSGTLVGHDGGGGSVDFYSAVLLTRSVVGLSGYSWCKVVRILYWWNVVDYTNGAVECTLYKWWYDVDCTSDGVKCR